ncbi:MAG: sterol desaturase family protein [Woeseiaceae bacterium]
MPFFLLAIVVEWIVDYRRGTQFVRLPDAMGSLSAGAMSTATGIFSKLVGLVVFAYVLEHWAWYRMPETWFDASPRGVLCWVLALLAWDFFYYWKHRLGHERSLFWAAHSVHHQSEEYNLTTALRQTSTDFLVGWTVYIPMFLVGLPVKVFVTVASIDLIYQFWVHTRHVGTLGWVDRVFVTPSNHRVHHAQNAAYIDKNYGGILVVWDRLFGTFQPELASDPVVFGVRKPLASFNPLTANLQVYQYLWFDAVRTRRWRDKLGIWFGRTGWRPRDMQVSAPAPQRSLNDFEKYSPLRSRRLDFYLMFQFAIAVVMSIGVEERFAGNLSITLLMNSLLCWLLINIGIFSDNRARGIAPEYLRLLLSIIFVGLASIFTDALTWPLVLLVIAYGGLSFLLFRHARAGLNDISGVDSPGLL